MDINSHLSQFICQELLDGNVEISDDDALLADGLVDSLGMMRLVAFISDTLGVEIPAEDVILENFSTISHMSSYLRSRGVKA